MYGIEIREKLNKHLTKNAILRIDYVPISDTEVDSINGKLAKELLLNGMNFSNMKQTFMRNIDIQMNDPSIQDFNEFINVKEKSRVKSYQYYKVDEDSNIEMILTFNRQFCSIDVNQYIRYYNYEIYRDIFLLLLEILKEQELIINRFSIKKFNEFFLKKDVPIDLYVKDKYFNLDCSDLLASSESFISEKRYTFLKNIYNVNLITHSSIGKLDDVIVKRIAFDIDVYIADLQDLKKLFQEDNEEYINRLNNELFCVYVHILNEKMISLLDRSSCIEDGNIVLGVERNENT